jgi:hypothetical protein
MFPGSGTSTPSLGLPDGTFSDADRETADSWAAANPELDYSDSDLVGGTREDRRAATVNAVGETVDDAADRLGIQLPGWAKYAVIAILLLLGAGVISYVFGQLFTVEL